MPMRAGASDMTHKALVFCLDAGGSVLRSHEVEFTSREDLVRQIRRELAHAETVEAWEGTICRVRLGAHGVAAGDPRSEAA